MHSREDLEFAYTLAQKQTVLETWSVRHTATTTKKTPTSLKTARDTDASVYNITFSPLD